MQRELMERSKALQHSSIFKAKLILLASLAMYFTKAVQYTLKTHSEANEKIEHGSCNELEASPRKWGHIVFEVKLARKNKQMWKEWPREQRA